MNLDDFTLLYFFNEKPGKTTTQMWCVCVCAHATMCRVTSMIYNHRSDFLTYNDLALLCPLLNGSNLSATGVGGHVTQPGPVIVLNSTGQDYWLKG